MDVTLLGTGAPAGLPRPGCPCANCAGSLGERARSATALLVDGVLLLDLTPGAALVAARAGRTLHEVRQVLLTPPHDGPPVEPVPGLPAPVRVLPGQELTLLTGHRVMAIPLDTPGTGYAVTGPHGDRLLYLPPGSALAGRVEGMQELGLCVLDVLGRPAALAGLRAAGAIGTGTEVVAAHIDHEAPPGAELDRRLAAAGARAVPDGTTLEIGAFHQPPGPPLRTLVLGGARSGKSAEAERRLAAFPGVQYVATGGRGTDDREWASRVLAHQERRPRTWSTLETCDLPPLLTREGEPPLLIDCLALWLTHTMDELAAWDDIQWYRGGEQVLAERVTGLAAAFRESSRTVVAVSNEVGSGIVPTTSSGRRFRDALGLLNAAIAAECEQVLLVTAGVAQRLRG